MAINGGNLAGRTLGNCVLEKLIGQGGMGAVYLAHQSRPARRVAVKVLLPSTAMDSDMHNAFLARFRREADVIAKLEHVNIMPIYEYGEEDTLAYLVMPYLAGGSLKEVLQRNGALSLEQAATYLDQAASALDYAHSQGVIHRDLKPANFLLASDGRLVLADFGIAHLMNDTATGSGLTSTGMIIGTPEYMAPEMINGEQVDYRADIYELGIVLFQMLMGQVPFKGSTPIVVITKHIQATLPSLHQLNPTIPVAVDAVIQKATAKKREDRYTSDIAFAREFRRAISSASQPLSNYSNSTTLYTGEPTIAPTSQQQYNNTVSAQHEPLYFNQGNFDNRSGSSYDYPPVNAPLNAPLYAPPPSYQPNSAPQTENFYPPPARNSNRMLPIVLGILIVLIVIVGSIAGTIVLNNKGNQGNASITPTAGATAQTTSGTTPTVATTPTSGATPSPTPTSQPTANPSPTSQPTVTSTQSSGVPVGSQLYSTVNPGPKCDSQGGTWDNYNGIQLTCQDGKTMLNNSTQSLAGTFLTSFPEQAYPSDYVVQVQLQQASSSNADFGIYFRNQPGNQLGTYTFLVHQDGTWSAYEYDNTTGQAVQLTRGSLGNSDAKLTLAVVVQGDTFTFYANGKKLASANSSTYSSGTAGIVVAAGGTVTASNFSLYTPAS